MKYYSKWARREYSLPKRLFLTFLAGIVFAFLIPYTLTKLLPKLDILLSIPGFYCGTINLIVGGLFLVIGGFFGFWSIGDQLFQARGTPVPFMATQTLLVTGPFRLCRNPMAFGAFLAYFGITVLVGSISAFASVIIFAVLLITYIKLIEEKELEARFGKSYLDYKGATPFMIPRIFP
jgi:protein-S-isoprenylcysteine O-methyltransferase Ste14